MRRHATAGSARWIACLLVDDGAYPEDAVELFNEQSDEVTTATWQYWLNRARNEVPTALYLLLRTFWLQEDEWLEQLVDSFENSPARLVADGVKLVKGLSARKLLVMEDEWVIVHLPWSRLLSPLER